MRRIQQVCRECGCTDRFGCQSDEAGPCWWVEDDLCSHCKSGIECDRAAREERILAADMDGDEDAKEAVIAELESLILAAMEPQAN